MQPTLETNAGTYGEARTTPADRRRDEPMAKRNYLVEGVSGTGKVQYVTNFEGVVIKPLMAIGNLLIRATLKRENEQRLMVMSTIYGTLIKLEK
jgi:hypothetical protein